MREGKAGVFAGRDGRGHAGHDLEVDPGGGQGSRLFAAAAEDERIAPFESNDRLSGAGRLDQPSIDFVLAADLAGSGFESTRALELGPTSAATAGD